MPPRMLGLAAKRSGYFGVESATEEVGMSASYWEHVAPIRNWKVQAEYRVAPSHVAARVQRLQDVHRLG